MFTFPKILNRFSGHFHVVRLGLIYSNDSSCNQLAINPVTVDFLCVGILHFVHCVLRGHFEHARSGLYGNKRIYGE